jgi:hypothetical protein
MALRSLSFILILAPIAAAACGGDDRAANYPPQSCPPGQSFDGQACVSPPPTASTTAPPVGSTPPPTGSTPAPSAGGSAKPLDTTAAAPAVQLLAPLAAQAAPPGAKPVGNALAGEFQQGQSLEGSIEMQAGKCYTAVGAGVPTVQDLDIRFVPVMPLPGMQPVVAEDKTTQNTAVIGEKPNCFKALIAGTMKVIVAVEAGQGIAAVQLYEK